MYADQYTDIVCQTVRAAWDTQRDVIASVARRLADTVKAHRNVFVFGCSHAGILAEEVFYRTGGLAVINPIFFPGFMLNTRPVTMTSQLERIPGIGKTLLDQNRVGEGDLLLIHSVSGRNTVPVEMALAARERGCATVAITNLTYSRAVSSRHPSGKRLFEVADTVLDNKGCVGDAAIRMDGLPEAIGPTSTAVGVALLNGVVIEAVELLLRDGVVPPVLMSANLDGGDEHNRRIFEDYRDNIFYQ